MTKYTVIDDVSCGSCLHYRRHYIKRKNGVYYALSFRALRISSMQVSGTGSALSTLAAPGGRGKSRQAVAWQRRRKRAFAAPFLFPSAEPPAEAPARPAEAFVSGIAGGERRPLPPSPGAYLANHPGSMAREGLRLPVGDAAQLGFRFPAEPALQGVADALDDLHDFQAHLVFLRLGDDFLLLLVQHVGELLVPRGGGDADGREHHAPPVFARRLARW